MMAYPIIPVAVLTGLTALVAITLAPSQPSSHKTAARALAPSRVAVVDGDTLRVDGKRVRLWGIDAPELEQACHDKTGAAYLCGVMAREALTAMIAGVQISCTQFDRDRYGRAVDVCTAEPVTLHDFDIGDAMVRAGWALDWARYSNRAYLEAEIEARQAGRGIWAGSFELPWIWRMEHK